MRLTVYKSTFSSANSRGASSNSHACFIVLTRLSQVRRGLQACWRPEGAAAGRGAGRGPAPRICSLPDYKPVSVPLRAAAIHLGRTLLPGSSDLPESSSERGAHG